MTKKASKKDEMEWWVIVLIIIGVFIVIGIVNSVLEPFPSTDPVKQLSLDKIKQLAIIVPYNDLFRYNEDYIGKIIYFKGKIVQIEEVSSNKYYMRVATEKDEFIDDYYENIIWVDNYSGNRLLENDIVDVWGKVVGLETYKSIFGQNITIPKVDALYVELVPVK